MAYEGEDIDVLEGLEPVRKRPGMFIGGTGKTGLHHLLWEVLDNSVDEVANEFANKIDFTLHKDGKSATISDDGRGIPVDEHPEHGVPALELILTTLHAGGKFDSENYTTSGGLHGVGVSVVNALSKKLVVEVKRDGKKYRQEYEKGKPTTKLEIVSKNISGSGTSIYFEPDPEIFESVEFDEVLIFDRLEVKTYLNKGLKINFIDEKNNEETEIKNEDGIAGYLENVIEGGEFNTVHDKPFVLEKDEELNGPESLEVALHWTENPEENIYSFVNGIPTEDGGTHEQGLKLVVKNVLDTYMDIHDLKPKRLDIKGKDTREGLVAVVNLFMTDPQFQGQTKDKLNNPSARSLITGSVRTEFEQHLNDHPSVGKNICERVIQAAKARKKKRSTSSGGGGGKSQNRLDLPGKLADCSSTDPVESELFLVEGDSAGGCFSGDTKVSLLDGRNLEFRKLVEEHKNGEEHFCYTVDGNGKIIVKKLKNPRKTKKNAKVIELVLNSNERITCTPSHKFMLVDGSYKKAKNLLSDDLLKPYGHRVKEKNDKNEKVDVYDLEVPETHNFGLASGVFVHNSAKQARDRNTQAVLPLRGKVLNSERASESRIRKNKELSSVIDTLGCGMGDDFNINDLRYYKIILLMDADTDGYHISILLLTFFYRYMKPLIKGGFVYMAQPPLYRINDGQKTHWASDDKEKNKILENSRTKNPDIQRFKGLGEMMPKSLKKTTLNPKTRKLLNVSIPESDKLLTEQIITQLMGRDTSSRYEFIMEQSKDVNSDNIDI